MHLLLDLSLTVAKPWLAPPSGIDRVEFAHALHWRSLPERDVTFVMRTAWGRLAAIPHADALRWLESVERHLAPGTGHREPALRGRSLAVMTRHAVGRGFRALRERLRARPDSVFLTVSCATLHHPASIAALRTRGCGVAALVHDLIPLTHPDCFAPGESLTHERRMEAVARLADAALTVTAAVADDLRAWAAGRGLPLPPVTVAHPGLGLQPGGPHTHAAGSPPYFLMLGSLEPRKNHRLMLDVWRTLAGRPGAPRLVVVGRKPARPHFAVEALERGAFGGLVEDRGRLPDAEVAALLAGARALLFPSLAEGFGIPLAEALAQGVPALASDIPAFREVGGDAPEFLDPLDGPGWRQAVLDYAADGSPRRAAQLARMAGWRAPSWDAHFATVRHVLEAVAAQASQRSRPGT